MPVAVDTNFLLALADSDNDAWDALATIRGKASHLPLIASPPVVSEVVYFARFDPSTPLGRSARKAVGSFSRDWRIHPAQLNPVQIGIADRVSLRLRRMGLVPEEEKHDSLILVEAALLNCVLLVTSDAELRGLDFARLVFELRKFELNVPVIATPKELARKFFR